MAAPNPHRIMTANDKAEILALIDSQRKRQNQSNSVQLQSRYLTIWISGDSVFSRGFARWSGTRTGDHHPAPFWTRETMCLARRPEGWRITHQETSALTVDKPEGVGSEGSTLRVDWLQADAAFLLC